MTVLTRLIGTLTTPLLPEDYLGLINPLWSTTELRGRITEVRRETAESATLVIKPGAGWPGHRPGQWLRIGVDINGVRHWRSYSISCAPGGVEITVKGAGYVSDFLVRRVRAGTIVGLDVPQGDFVLPRDPGKVLFLTAGSGITPVMSMLRSGVADAVLVHSAPSRAAFIFGRELQTMPGLKLHEHFSRRSGRLDLTSLPTLVPDLAERQVWACGPESLLREIEEHFPAVRTERFRLTPAVVGDGGEITLTRSGVVCESTGPILDAGESAGALMPSGCRMGICFTCVGRLTSGKVRDLRTGEVHGDEGELIQTCVSAAAGPVSIEL
ncbi:MAG: ferredoxin reductase [Streptosporangiaceae bacterium]